MIQIERTLLNIFTCLPAFPPSWRDKLSKYAWILVLILAVLGVLSVIFFVALLMYLRYAVGNYLFHTAYVQLLIPSFIIGAALNVASIVLLWCAVSPLKKMRKKGWDLAFYSLLLLLAAQVFLPIVVTLLYVVSHTVASHTVLLRMLDIPSISRWIVIVAVLFYLLFQVHASFGKDKASLSK